QQQPLRPGVGRLPHLGEGDREEDRADVLHRPTGGPGPGPRGEGGPRQDRAARPREPRLTPATRRGEETMPDDVPGGLGKASQRLLYPRESDAPFTPFRWKAKGGRPAVGRGGGRPRREEGEPTGRGGVGRGLLLPAGGGRGRRAVQGPPPGAGEAAEGPGCPPRAP